MISYIEINDGNLEYLQKVFAFDEDVDLNSKNHLVLYGDFSSGSLEGQMLWEWLGYLFEHRWGMADTVWEKLPEIHYAYFPNYEKYEEELRAWLEYSHG